MNNAQTLRDREHPSSALAIVYYSNLAIPFVAAGLTLATIVALGIEPSAWVLALVTSGAYLIYVVERAWLMGPEDVHNHPDRVAWIVRHRSGMILTTMGAVAVHALALSRVASVQLIPIVALLVAVAGVYCLPILPGGERLKSIWFLKPFIIAAAWSLGTVVLPALVVGQLEPGLIYTLCFYRFLFLLPNTLLADVPDVAGDATVGLATIASRLSESVPLVAQVIAGLLPVVGFLLWALTDLSWYIVIDSLIGLVFLGAYRAARKEGTAPRIFYDLHMDVIMASPLLCALVYALVNRMH